MLQQVTSHLEAHLTRQLQESVQRLESTAANTYLLTQSEAAEGSRDPPPLTPTQRLEYLKQIQTQSDQLVMRPRPGVAHRFLILYSRVFTAIKTLWGTA